MSFLLLLYSLRLRGSDVSILLSVLNWWAVVCKILYDFLSNSFTNFVGLLGTRTAKSTTSSTEKAWSSDAGTRLNDIMWEFERCVENTGEDFLEMITYMIDAMMNIGMIFFDVCWEVAEEALTSNHILMKFCCRGTWDLFQNQSLFWEIWSFNPDPKLSLHKTKCSGPEVGNFFIPLANNPLYLRADFASNGEDLWYS